MSKKKEDLSGSSKFKDQNRQCAQFHEQDLRQKENEERCIEGEVNNAEL